MSITWTCEICTSYNLCETCTQGLSHPTHDVIQAFRHIVLFNLDEQALSPAPLLSLHYVQYRALQLQSTYLLIQISISTELYTCSDKFYRFSLHCQCRVCRSLQSQCVSVGCVEPTVQVGGVGRLQYYWRVWEGGCANVGHGKTAQISPYTVTQFIFPRLLWYPQIINLLQPDPT